MRNSLYEFACICGQHFAVEDPHEFLCPRCGRALVVEWREPVPMLFARRDGLEANGDRRHFSLADRSHIACGR